jgi:hypothetical protein
MVGKKIIYLILFSIVSCNGAKENAKVEKEEPKIEFSYLILKDSILIDQINQYYDSVCPNEINNKIGSILNTVGNHNVNAHRYNISC